jgi:hypothetical protein
MRNSNRNKAIVTQFRERRHASEHEMIQIALLARKYAKDDGRSESSFDDMDRAWDELKRRKNPNRPYGGRRTRRRRGGDENEYVVPKQPTYANDPAIVAPLLQARRSLRNPLPLGIKTPKQTEAQIKLSNLTPTATPRGARRRTRRKV